MNVDTLYIFVYKEGTYVLNFYFYREYIVFGKYNEYILYILFKNKIVLAISN